MLGGRILVQENKFASDSVVNSKMVSNISQLIWFQRIWRLQAFCSLQPNAFCDISTINTGSVRSVVTALSAKGDFLSDETNGVEVN